MMIGDIAEIIMGSEESQTLSNPIQYSERMVQNARRNGRKVFLTVEPPDYPLIHYLVLSLLILFVLHLPAKKQRMLPPITFVLHFKNIDNQKKNRADSKIEEELRRKSGSGSRYPIWLSLLLSVANVIVVAVVSLILLILFLPNVLVVAFQRGIIWEWDYYWWRKLVDGKNERRERRCSRSSMSWIPRIE